MVMNRQNKEEKQSNMVDIELTVCTVVLNVNTLQ